MKIKHNFFYSEKVKLENFLHPPFLNMKFGHVKLFQCEIFSKLPYIALQYPYMLCSNQVYKCIGGSYIQEIHQVGVVYIQQVIHEFKTVLFLNGISNTLHSVYGN